MLRNRSDYDNHGIFVLTVTWLELLHNAGKYEECITESGNFISRCEALSPDNELIIKAKYALCNSLFKIGRYSEAEILAK